jgi:hypothetical protein
MAHPQGPVQRRNKELATLARAQHGLITRPQALAQGLSASAISRRCLNGGWQRVLPNVFVSVSAPQTPGQQLKAVELWAGEGAAISHRSALQLWGGAANVDFIEVSTSNRRRPRQGIRVHRARLLPDGHVVMKDGIRVTSAERTLVDLASLLGEEMQFILDDFFQRGVATPAMVALFLERDDVKRVPGCHLLRRILRRRRRAAPRTLPEKAYLLEQVLKRNVAARVATPELLPQVAEAPPTLRMGYESERLVLELGEEDTKEAGKWRAKLRGEGWELLAIGCEDLRGKPWKLVRRLREKLQRRAGASSRPPQTGRVYNEWRLRDRLAELTDFGALPPALANVPFHTLMWMLGMNDFENLSPEGVDALNTIIDEMNAVARTP